MELDTRPKSGDRPNGQVTGKMTPLMTQYWDVKAAHADKIILFRMGDFFEMFHRDAEIAAPVLGIALTSRNKKSADETPMCGVPHHSVAGSINKLLQNGFKVAICDQIEDPKLAKGLVKRAVTRILSPGVVYDPDTLDGLRANYLASLDDRSVSFLDTTTGEAFYFFVKDLPKRLRLIESLQPVEIVVSQALRESLAKVGDILVSTHEELAKPIADWPESSRRLLSYVVSMQGAGILETIAPFEARELLDRMTLSPTVLRHLEIFETYHGEAQGSLFHAINRAKTSSGSRLLKSWFQFPLLNIEAIERRYDRIEYWRSRSEELKNLRQVLGGLGDIQRRLAKIGNPSVNPRDFQALSDSLKAGLEVSSIAKDRVWDAELLSVADAISREIDSTIADEPPIQLKNGGIIRRGYSAELDELLDLSTDSHKLILEMEARERESTGISSLKIRFNNVFGYYIEITNTHKDRVPKDRYERKQTLANAERYLTPELAEIESKVLSAQSKRVELESQIFQSLIAKCLKEAQRLLKLATAWAEIDALSALSWLAIEQDFCRPKLIEKGGLSLIASRHPVIEQALSLPFVANDIRLTRGGCLLLTGPNMAGKSTLMRQVAISALLAQAGSFVPAREAELPVFDQIFTRIGASDSLSEGLSTFMVEMKETAEILDLATEDSLVVLDEIGRGTSTYDGMSLAQSILEFLLEKKSSMALFATHYHELTALAAQFPNLECGHMRIHEENGQVAFLHQLAKGPANKSYGIHVAKLAGLPPAVTKRAAAVLKRLESGVEIDAKQMTMMSFIDRAVAEASDIVESAERSPIAVPAVSPELEEIRASLRALDIGRLTPLEALNQISKWQQSLS